MDADWKGFFGTIPNLGLLVLSFSFLAIEHEQSPGKGKRHKHFFVDYQSD